MKKSIVKKNKENITLFSLLNNERINHLNGRDTIISFLRNFKTDVAQMKMLIRLTKEKNEKIFDHISIHSGLSNCSIEDIFSFYHGCSYTMLLFGHLRQLIGLYQSSNLKNLEDIKLLESAILVLYNMVNNGDTIDRFTNKVMTILELSVVVRNKKELFFQYMDSILKNDFRLFYSNIHLPELCDKSQSLATVYIVEQLIKRKNISTRYLTFYLLGCYVMVGKIGSDFSNDYVLAFVDYNEFQLRRIQKLSQYNIPTVCKNIYDHIQYRQSLLGLC